MSCKFGILTRLVNYVTKMLNGITNTNFITDRTVSVEQKCCNQVMKVTPPTASAEVKEFTMGMKNIKAPSTAHLQAEGFRYDGNEIKTK